MTKIRFPFEALTLFSATRHPRWLWLPSSICEGKGGRKVNLETRFLKCRGYWHAFMARSLVACALLPYNKLSESTDWILDQWRLVPFLSFCTVWDFFRGCL